MERGMEGADPTCVLCVVSADLRTRNYHKQTVNTKGYMSDVGFRRFIADTTHPGIYHIIGLRGLHLHNSFQHHVDALKPIQRYLATRTDDGPVYDKKALSDLLVTRTVTTQHVGIHVYPDFVCPSQQICTLLRLKSALVQTCKLDIYISNCRKEII